MTEQNTNSSQRKKSLIMFIILIILITIAVLGKGYFWPYFRERTVDLQSQLVQKQVIIQELQNQKEIQKQDMAKVASWELVAASHLVRMADLTLNTTRDVKTALAFLLAAKKYTSNPSLNKDIAALQAVPVVDAEELVLKIDAVSQQIGVLSVTPSRVAVAPTTTTTEVSQLFTNVIKALKNIVIIRHQTVEPMLLPEQTVILLLSIQTKLLQAELAVMQKQNKLYQACLTQVADLITKYFSCNNNAAVANILHIIQELKKINLQPDLPGLSLLSLTKEPLL